MPTPGRNDPCPCGSGRKYKHCCLRAADAEDAARVRLRTAEGVLVPALFAFAGDEWGDAFFDEAWEEFFAGAALPEAVDESREFGTTFDPFFVFSFVPDPTLGELPEGWPTEPVALHFLHHEIESCPDSRREFIEQACRSHPSFFVIEATVPGRSIDLKDVLTGRRFPVQRQEARGSKGSLLLTAGPRKATIRVVYRHRESVHPVDRGHREAPCRITGIPSLRRLATGPSSVLSS